MRRVLCLVVGVALLAVALPAMAGDIVVMPTANTVAGGHAELNYIRWNFSHEYPLSTDWNVYEAFVGVTDRIEVDVVSIDKNPKTLTEANVYLTLLKESAVRPSLIVGATNCLESSWLGGMNDASPFVVSAYNANVPAGKPSFNDPLVRLHVGWGDKFHNGWFGGFQFLFTPYLGGAILNYQGEPSYMATLIPGKSLELTAGYKNGCPFYRGGVNFDW